jgi:hypothetical protein
MLREGLLEIILADHEPPPLPVHLIAPNGRLSVPKVRAFVDFAVPRLRHHFARVALDASERGGIVKVTGGDGRPGIGRDRRQEIARRSPPPPSRPRTDHRPYGMALSCGQPQPTG